MAEFLQNREENSKENFRNAAKKCQEAWGEKEGFKPGIDSVMNHLRVMEEGK